MPVLRGSLVVLLLLAVACTRPSAEPRTRGTPAPGRIKEASVEEFHAILRGMRGKPVVVNYWASWCIPCAAEMPRLVAAATSYGERVRFLGVNVQDVRSSAAAFAKKFRIPFPSVADPRGDIQRDEKLLGLPVTQFYGPDGKLAFQNSGEIKQDDLDAKLRDLVRIASPGPSAKN